MTPMEILQEMLQKGRELSARIYRAFNKRAVFLAHTGGMAAAVLLFASAWIYYGVTQPSAFFPTETIITIPQGATLSEVAELLDGEGVVRSAFAFRTLVGATGRGAQVMAGDYIFETKLTLSEVTDKVTRGEFGLEPVRVTVPEGATSYQMATLFEKKFPKFDSVAFLMLASEKEGYLFPDTYFFLPNVNATDILTVLEGTFYEKLQTLEEQIALFGKPVHEIITMASLLEKEARDPEERRTIAGVLWERLSIGMPLQVDAVFGFIKRTETFNPKFSDLVVDSPYNTYQNKGLPPGPIGSPSLSSLQAAVTPIPTEELFYLHGRDGNLYTAATYNQHLVNRRRYLD